MNKRYLILIGVIIILVTLSTFYILSGNESNVEKQVVVDASFTGTWKGDSDLFNKVSFSESGEVCVISKHLFEEETGFTKNIVTDISNITIYGNYTIDDEILTINIFTKTDFSYSIEGNKLTFGRFSFVKESDEYEDPAVDLENVSDGEEATIKNYLIDGEKFIVNGFLEGDDFIVVSKQVML